MLWFISGHAWLREGMEGDLLGVTSTGEEEYTTSAAGSGTSVGEKKKCIYKNISGEMLAKH